MGIIETSSGELDVIKGEIAKMRTLTTKPFGVNVALAFVRDPGIVNFIIDQGVKFVTTSAGDPQKIVAPLKAAGLTVFHVVPSLKTALRAIDCGVDGLVVEGGEGGGFKNPREVATMVLLPLVCETVKVPVIAGRRHGRWPHHGGGLHARRRRHPDGHAHGVVAESPVHMNWKNAILAAEETGTVFLNRFGPGPALRALRTEKTTRIEKEPPPNIMAEFGKATDLYFGGDMESSSALSGQVAGRIHDIKPVKQVIDETIAEFHDTITKAAKRYA